MGHDHGSHDQDHHEGHDHASHDHAAHGHAHGGHGHSHAPADFGRAFAIGVSLNLGYVVIEAFFGVASGSMALLADAGHNLSDVFGLVLAWIAATLAKRRPTAQRTYGYKRGPILASLANAVFLLVATGAIVWESTRRLIHPAPVVESTIVWVAVIGVLVNAGTALMFMSGRKDDLNVRGAFLHMVADAAVTVGVIVAALVIGWTGWLWLDPVASLAISVVIVAGTWGLLRDSFALAMDAVPPGIDPQHVRDYFIGLPGVDEVHDLHIWGLSTTETAVTAHLVRADASGDGLLLERIGRETRDRFGIGHVTIQLETPETASRCELRSDHVV
ncbi:cation diffusion facilitator family transporter [Lichenifustis flavocetrariae]|uniref:Cation diffusion facilitator family transporter n=1 Tax=Lichenifustis flavocetrariae TaxID=2949735 RepID=A0AA41YXS1_9HYPH|nr:cation diffusion facilitator family transporter [Lichenifustis flavocetrariae]MCW6508968.1 cation diffusion facilitator family transporter [Lichenifustis flavocetrariae]